MLLLTASGNACRPSKVGAAASAADLGLSSESTPWPMNATDKSGRAIPRINIAGGFPCVPANKPPDVSPQLSAVLPNRRRYGGSRASVDHRRRAKRLLRGWLAGRNRRRRAGPRHQRLSGGRARLSACRGHPGLPHRPWGPLLRPAGLFVVLAAALHLRTLRC